MLYTIRAWPNTINIGGVRLAPTDFEAYQKLHCHHQLKPSAASPRDASAGPKTRKRMGCAASTGPLYRDEHDFATTAAYYDRDDDVKKDWVENEQLGEGMFARVVKITRKSTNQQYACKVLRKTTVIDHLVRLGQRVHVPHVGRRRLPGVRLAVQRRFGRRRPLGPRPRRGPQLGRRDLDDAGRPRRGARGARLRLVVVRRSSSSCPPPPPHRSA